MDQFKKEKDFVPDQSIDFLMGKVSQARSTISQIQSIYDALDTKLEGKEGEVFQRTLDLVKALKSKLMGLMDGLRHQVNEYHKLVSVKERIASKKRKEISALDESDKTMEIY